MHCCLLTDFYTHVHYTSLEQHKAQNGRRILSVWQQHFLEVCGGALGDRKWPLHRLHPDAAGTDGEAAESGEGDKSPVLTFETAAGGRRVDGAQGGRRGRSSGAAEEDESGTMKSGGPASRSVDRVVITAVFSLFHNKHNSPHFSVNAPLTPLPPIPLPLSPFYPQSPLCQRFAEI